MRDRGISPLSSLGTGAAGAVGAVLGAIFAVTARIRRSKPLHSVGVVARGLLTVAPDTARSGSPLLDEPGEHVCLVRASYAMGTGPRLPDIEGFALRVLPKDPAADLTDVLFASTGEGSWGRHVLTLRPPGRHDAQTTLLPVRAGGCPLQLRLEPLDSQTQPWPSSYRLSWAHGRGPWHHFGGLAVSWGEPRDAPDRFDPVVNQLPGTSQYAAVAWLREPAYKMVRLAWQSAGRLPASIRAAQDPSMRP